MGALRGAGLDPQNQFDRFLVPNMIHAYVWARVFAGFLRFMEVNIFYIEVQCQV